MELEESTKRPKGEEVTELFREARGDSLAPTKDLDYYFSSYSKTSIHYDMLRDSVRTRAYQDAMQKNPELLKGKTVLDLGCGTGILSMFAAKAGAARVYGAEMASIYKQAEKIVKHNKLEGVISILHGKMEDLKLPFTKVDAIVSEWMGYLLFYESMFDSVIDARDRYLVPGGKLFPNIAKMFIAGVFDGYDFTSGERLRDYLGVDLSYIHKVSNVVPSVTFVDPQKIITSTAELISVDLERCSKDDLDFVQNFTLVADGKGFLNGFVVWFDVEFTHGSPNVVLSTSPYKEGTHWKQTGFFLDKRIPVFQGDSIQGTFWLRRNKKNFRCIDVKIRVKVQNSLGDFDETQFFLFQ